MTCAWSSGAIFARNKKGLFRYSPGNSGMNDSSGPLLRESFAWARAMSPKQPLSSGVWTGDYRSPAAGSLTALTVAEVYSQNEPDEPK